MDVLTYEFIVCIYMRECDRKYVSAYEKIYVCVHACIWFYEIRRHGDV